MEIGAVGGHTLSDKPLAGWDFGMEICLGFGYLVLSGIWDLLPMPVYRRQEVPAADSLMFIRGGNDITKRMNAK